MAAFVEIAGYAESETMPPSRFFAADSEFHRLIARATGNDMLQDAVEDGRAAMFLPVGAIFTKLHPSANEHHDEIFDAILHQDPARAEAAMVEHIEGTRGALREFAEGPARSRRRTRPKAQSTSR
jgi:DNA-binding GntR family transcriptional regulator